MARAFETIAMAKVATSARPKPARLGILSAPATSVTINRDFLLNDAKNTVLAMNLEGFKPPLRPKDDIRVMGRDGLAVFEAGPVRNAQVGTSSPTMTRLWPARWPGCFAAGVDSKPIPLVSPKNTFWNWKARSLYVSLCGNEGDSGPHRTHA